MKIGIYKELRDLRKFLKQPLVGAFVQTLRKSIQEYTSSNLHDLVNVVRGLYQQQGDHAPEKPGFYQKRGFWSEKNA